MSDTEAFAEEPQVTEAPKRGRGRPKGSKNKAPTKPLAKSGRRGGDSLVPDFSSETIGVGVETLWWVGIFPDCPVDFITMGGVEFCKATARPYRDSGGKQQRQALVGNVVTMTLEKFEKICEALPRTVVRWTRKRESSDLPKGQKITIPTKDQLERRRKAGKTTRAYVRHPNDTPAARWVFAVPHDGREPSGTVDSFTNYPPSIEETGLEWPEE